MTIQQQQGEQHIANLQRMLQRIQTDPGLVHPVKFHATVDLLQSGIAATKREMKNSRQARQLSLRNLKIIVTKILSHAGRKWKQYFREDEPSWK